MQKKFLHAATELSLLFKTTTLLAAFGKLCLLFAIDKDVLFVAFAISGAKWKKKCLTFNLRPIVYELDSSLFTFCGIEFVASFFRNVIS